MGGGGGGREVGQCPSLGGGVPCFEEGAGRFKALVWGGGIP